MTTPLTHEEFAKHVNTKFLARVDDTETVELEMIELSELLTSSRQERFSVIFRGPREKALQQGTRRFVHDQMGEFDLFIVPVGVDAGSVTYEAGFNRLIKPPDTQIPS